MGDGWWVMDDGCIIMIMIMISRRWGVMRGRGWQRHGKIVSEAPDNDRSTPTSSKPLTFASSHHTCCASSLLPCGFDLSGSWHYPLFSDSSSFKPTLQAYLFCLASIAFFIFLFFIVLFFFPLVLLLILIKFCTTNRVLQFTHGKRAHMHGHRFVFVYLYSLVSRGLLPLINRLVHCGGVGFGMDCAGMAEVAKVLYIMVHEDGEKGKETFRYTRPVLQSTLQLMGCKARHAFKVIFFFFLFFIYF